MPEAAAIAAGWKATGNRSVLCRRLLAHVQQGVAAVLFFQLITITVVVLAGVISRYVFNSSFPWTEELASWTLVSLTFVGMAAGHISDRHLSIDLLERFRPAPWVRSAQRLVVDMVVAAATILLLTGGIAVLRHIGGVSAALQWDARIKYAVIPIAAVASLVFILLARLAGGASWSRALGPMIVAGALCATAAVWGSPFEDISPSAVMAVAFFGGMFLGVPIGYAMLFAAFLGGWGGDLIPIAGVVDSVVQGTSAFVILAVPFFLTAGYLMNSGGMSERLIDFASALVGHFHGGLAQANVFHSVMLGGVCGSTSADAASTTKILVPEMIRRGYAPEFACAVTAVGSILPACFPPSIALLIYASVAGVSVAQMFIAGIVPGFLLCAVMMLTVHVIARRRHYEKAPRRAPVATMARAGLRAAPAMFVAVVIVGLLRAGVMTATEVGTIAVIWAFVIGKFVYRGFTFRQCYHDLSECALDTALITFLVGVASPVAWVMVVEQLPDHAVAFLTGMVHQKWEMLLLVNVGALIAGCLLEIVPSILILAPLLTPLLGAMGVDPIHLGIIIVLNLVLAMVAPPIGILVFVSTSIARIPAGPVFRECFPFVVTCFGVLLLITFVPAISLTLWRLIGG